MKIKFLESVAGPGLLYPKGEIIDLPPKEAVRWIMRGTAKEVDPCADRPLKKNRKSKARKG